MSHAEHLNGFADKVRREVADGLLFTHQHLNENTSSSLQAASFLYGLIEILNEKGLISIEELDARKQDVAKRLVKKNRDKGVGILLQDPEYDKYTFNDEAEIECVKYVHLCQAACCRLPFALSKQDIREGIVFWDLGRPYIIAQEKDGYCTHLDQSCWCCAVRGQRPVPCRAYDCRKDNKIWLDFENKIINPDIRDSQWPRNATPETETNNPP